MASKFRFSVPNHPIVIKARSRTSINANVDSQTSILDRFATSKQIEKGQFPRIHDIAVRDIDCFPFDADNTLGIIPSLFYYYYYVYQLLTKDKLIASVASAKWNILSSVRSLRSGTIATLAPATPVRACDPPLGKTREKHAAETTDRAEVSALHCACAPLSNSTTTDEE